MNLIPRGMGLILSSLYNKKEDAGRPSSSMGCCDSIAIIIIKFKGLTLYISMQDMTTDIDVMINESEKIHWSQHRIICDLEKNTANRRRITHLRFYWRKIWWKKKSLREGEKTSGLTWYQRTFPHKSCSRHIPRDSY